MPHRVSTRTLLVLLSASVLGCAKDESDSEQLCDGDEPAPYLINEGCTVTDPELAASACFEQAGDDPERQAQCEQLEVGTELFWFDCNDGSCAQQPVRNADGELVINRYVGDQLCQSGEVCTIPGEDCLPGYGCECRDHIRRGDAYCECHCSSP